jgi:hypothetical protein
MKIVRLKDRILTKRKYHQMKRDVEVGGGKMVAARETDIGETGVAVGGCHVAFDETEVREEDLERVWRRYGMERLDQT